MTTESTLWGQLRTSLHCQDRHERLRETASIFRQWARADAEDHEQALSYARRTLGERDAAGLDEVLQTVAEVEARLEMVRQKMSHRLEQERVRGERWLEGKFEAVEHLIEALIEAQSWALTRALVGGGGSYGYEVEAVVEARWEPSGYATTPVGRMATGEPSSFYQLDEQLVTYQQGYTIDATVRGNGGGDEERGVWTVGSWGYRRDV